MKTRVYGDAKEGRMAKRSGILGLMVMVAGLAFAAGRSEEVEPDDDVVRLRLVGKDNAPSEQINVDHIDRIEAAMYAATGVRVDVELVQIPEGSYAEKLNLMLMGGDIPDIIYFQGNDQTIANQGILEDLRPYVAGSQVMQTAMLDFNRARIESYPYLLWLAPPRVRVPMVRRDWYEAYGGEVETVEQYYDMLSSFVENDFDGNGVVDSIGLTDTGNTDRIDFVFAHAFGITSTWMVQDGSYVYGRVTDQERDKLAFYHRLYDEGILDPEYITTRWDTMEDKLYAARVGMVASSAGIVVDIYANKMERSEAGSSLVILPPALGISQGFSVDVTKESRGWAISAGSEHKDEAWAFLEFMATDEGQMLDRLGFEGVHYQTVDGRIELTDRYNEWWPRYHEVVGWEPPVEILSDDARRSLQIAVAYAVDDINFVIPRELAPTWDALRNLYREYAFRFITGEYPLERFDEFVDRWYEIGGTELTEYANSVLP